MCGGGNSIEDMNLTSIQGRDPATERRQVDFWNQAQQYAATDPFQAQYGGPSAMPGMGAMSQQGQQYLTNQILGSGAYGGGWVNPNDPTATRQNLGFMDYTGPEEGTGYGQRWPSPDWGYEVNEEPITGRTAVRRPRTPGGPPDPPEPPEPPPFPDPSRSAYNRYGGSPANILGQAPGGSNIIGAQFGLGATKLAQAQGQSAQPQGQSGPSAYAGYLAPGQGGLLGSRAEEGAMRAAQAAGPGMIGASDPGWEAFLATKSPATQASLRAQAAQHPNMAVALYPEQQRPAQAARPYSPTVGVRGIEEAGDVTRRMLREPGRIGDPGYNQFLQGGGTPGTPGYVAPGWQGISAPGYRQFMDVPTGGTAPGTWQGISPAAGTGAFLPAHTDASGQAYVAGWHGLGEAGTGTAPTTPGVGLPGDYAVPTVDEMAIRGQVDPTTGLRATPFGITNPTGVTVGDIDPTTGQPLIDPATGLPAGDIRAVTAQGMDALAPWQRFDAAGDPTNVGYQPRYDAIAAGGIVPTTLDEGGEPIAGTAPGYSVTGPTAADYTAAKLGTLAGGFQLGEKDKLGAAIPGTGLLTAGTIGPATGYDIAAPDPLYKDWDAAQLGERGTDKVTDILGQTDPVTGEPVTGKGFREGWGITDPTISGTDWTGATPWDEKVTSTGVDVSQITTPTLTDAQRIGATEVGSAATAGFGVTPKTIAGPTTVSVDPVTGEITEDVAAVTPGTIAGPGAVSVDPVTGQATQAVAGVTPGAIAGPSGVTVDPVTGRVSEGIGGAVTPGGFSGASFLTGDLDPYMNQLGIQSQIEAAQLDYGRAQNEEQARRAASHAWGTRGDIPRAEQEQQMLARIADIRRQGFSDAADRMEFDLQRQQAAGMQYQQLQMQGQLAGREEESQRREANAARAQQAGLAGQQLGTQAALQTQQLRQAGDIRGAELGLQAGLQGQQLEAQRRSEDAARAQQAALAGQQLGTQAAMQTQQLGQAGGIRGAELGLQAQMQGQQLQAQRRESDAARAQQAAMQGLQLGTQADLQTQQLTQQGGIRGTELGVQTGMQAQQLEAQRLEANAARTQQAALAGQQLGGQYALQTQALGQQGAMRNAEMEMQAALANQQAALQTGTQSQQLEAQRQIEQARMKLSAQQQSQQLGVQTGLAAQQLEAQRVGDRAARAQQAGLAQQQVGAQAALQRQQLGVGADIRKGELDLQASLANQQAAMQSGSQTQQIQSQRDVQQAEMAFQRAQQTQQLKTQAGTQKAAFTQEGRVRQAELDLEAARSNQAAQLQTGSQSAQLEAGRRQRKAELDLQRQQGTQALTGQAAMQKQQLQQQTYIQSAQNDLESARADQQTAFESGNQTAQLEAQRKIREEELKLQAGMQTQQLGAGAAEQQTQNEFARRQALAGMGQDAATQQTQNEFARRQQLAQMGLTSAQQQSQNEFLRRQDLSRMGLQAQGMGMDDQARFRQQQMLAAQQLAGIGGMEQGAAFGAAGQLGQMGAAQEQAQRMQQAYAYEQWLRGIEGGSEGLSLLQAMQPGGQQWGYQRKPSVTGQIIGGLAQLGGTAAAMGQAGLISDVRLKENIELVGSDNGFNLYEFNYRNQDARWRGVMAQEVMVTRPDAVGMREGVLVVDYDALGMRMEAV